MKVIITFIFCCDHLRKSKFMALEKPGKLRLFFYPTLWPPCVSSCSKFADTVQRKVLAVQVVVFAEQ